MKKTFVLLAMVLIGTSAIAQNKYFTKTGLTTFEASVPSFEEVKAKNESTTAILNTSNGEFAALVLVKGFRFKNALMEEHFNENYADSDDFPKATFKGTISDFDSSKLGETATKHSFTGKLTFHGETKTLTNQELSIAMVDGVISISGTFTVEVSDFAIEIPKVVSNKLSKNVDVGFDFKLNKK